LVENKSPRPDFQTKGLNLLIFEPATRRSTADCSAVELRGVKIVREATSF